MDGACWLGGNSQRFSDGVFTVKETPQVFINDKGAWLLGGNRTGV